MCEARVGDGEAETIRVYLDGSSVDSTWRGLVCVGEGLSLSLSLGKSFLK